MPNYAINTTYQPFSFQERLAPLLMAKEEYDNVGATLSTLGDEANAWQQYIDPESRSGKILAQYNQTLANTADSLSRDGLKAVSRNTLFGLRRVYTHDIAKINKAAETLAGINNQYRSMLSKDQTLMKGQMPTVDDLVDNPSASPVLVSGNQLYAQGAAAAKSASARNVSNSAALSSVLRGYYELVQRTGYDSNAVSQFLRDASTIPELQGAMNQIREMYGTGNLDNPGQADQYILRGILDGMSYSEKIDYKYDQVGAENRAFARQKQLAQLQSQFNSAVPLQVRNIYTQRERTEDAKTIDSISKWFTETGSGFKLNEDGKKAFKKALADYNATQTASKYPSGYNVGTYHSHPSLESFINASGIDSYDEEALEKAYTDFYRRHTGDLYDATRASEYAYRVDPSQSAIWMDNLRSLARDGILYAAEFNQDAGKFVDGDEIKTGDLKGATFLSFNASPYGNTADILTKNGEHLTLRMNGYNQGVDSLIQQSVNNIGVGEERIARTIEAMGLDPAEVGDPRVLLNYLIQEAQQGNQEAAYWAQYLAQELQSYQQDQSGLVAAMSQYGNTNKTKPTEFAGFDF